ncbi:TPA: hypothetical protein ACT9M9_001656 [Legionella pneumophila]|nr:hypothetical protein [Legionella pneumophila]
MSAEIFLSDKLRRFEVIDYIFVILVYYVFGLMILSVYPPLMGIAWWFYLIVLAICAFPLIIHLISQPGKTLLSKFNPCVKSNTPSLQVLLSLVMFFAACIVVSFIPMLAHVKWWVYLIIMVLLSLKPLQKNWFW